MSRRSRERDRGARRNDVLCRVAYGVAALVLGCAPGDPDRERMRDIRNLQAAERFEDSIAPLRDALATAPDHAEALYRLGRALVETGHTSEAVWPLHKAAASEDYRVQAGTLLARVFLVTQNFEEAIRAAERVLETSPDEAEARRFRGAAALGAGHSDEALAEAERLLAREPDSPENLALRGAALVALERMDEAEKVYRQVRTVTANSRDRAMAMRGCLALVAFHVERQEFAQADKESQDCLRRFPAEPLVLQMATDIADRLEDPDKAISLWRSATEIDPDNLLLHAALAERLERAGKAEEARRVLRAAVERLDSSAAWQLLADFNQRQGDATAAEVALREVGKRDAQSSEMLAFTRADLLVDTGKLDEAETLAGEIEDAGLRDLMRARILAARGEYQRAMAAFDAGIPRWPNNAGARFLAGQIAERMGQFDRAVQEYRAAVRAGREQTDAALAAARLYFALKEYGYALEFGGFHAQTDRPSAAEGLVIAARAATASRQYELARRIAARLADRDGYTVIAVVEQAAVERAARGAAAAAGVMEAAEIDLYDPKNLVALRALVDHLLAADRPTDALAYVETALARTPEAAPIHDLHGRALAHTARTTEAQSAFERAVALDGSYAPALAGLATLTAKDGNWEAAVKLFDRAVASDPLDVESRYHAAQLITAAGKIDEARRRLAEIVDLAPTYAGACNDLAWLLAEAGQDLDRALRLAERATTLDPTADTFDTLGWVLLRRGERADAVARLEQALAMAPDSATVAAHLAAARAEPRNR